MVKGSVNPRIRGSNRVALWDRLEIGVVQCRGFQYINKFDRNFLSFFSGLNS